MVMQKIAQSITGVPYHVTQDLIRAGIEGPRKNPVTWGLMAPAALVPAAITAPYWAPAVASALPSLATTGTGAAMAARNPAMLQRLAQVSGKVLGGVGHQAKAWATFGSGGIFRTLKALPPSKWKMWGQMFRDLTSTNAGKAKFAWRALAQAEMAKNAVKPVYNYAKRAVGDILNAYGAHVDVEAARNEMAVLIEKQRRGEKLTLQELSILNEVKKKSDTFADDVGTQVQQTLDKQKSRLENAYDNAGKALTMYIKGKTQGVVDKANGMWDGALNNTLALYGLIASSADQAEKDGWRRVAQDQAKIEVANKRVRPDILSWFDAGPGTDWTDYVRTFVKDAIRKLPGYNLMYNTMNDAYAGGLFGLNGWKTSMVPDWMAGGANGFLRSVPLFGENVPDVVRRGPDSTLGTDASTVAATTASVFEGAQRGAKSVGGLVGDKGKQPVDATGNK